MFQIHLGADGEVVMAGRLDATQCETALEFLNARPAPRVIDLAALEYIASGGLRVLLLTHKRARADGRNLVLVNLQAPVHDVLRYTGFDRIFDLTRATS
ncbi:MAG: STAS domain-containing protein [Steroidobacteraceae bacterium]